MKSIYFKCNSNCKHMYFKSIIWIPKTICTLSIFSKPILIKSWERANVIFHNFSCFKCLYEITFIYQIPFMKDLYMKYIHHRTFIYSLTQSIHIFNRIYPLFMSFTHSSILISFDTYPLYSHHLTYTITLPYILIVLCLT